MTLEIELPKTCSLIENGNATLLIKNEYKEKLLRQGILSPEQLIENTPSIPRHFKGRSFLPSVLIQESKSFDYIMNFSDDKGVCLCLFVYK